MRRVLQLFVDFAEHPYDAKYFHVDLRGRLLVRAIQSVLPVGIWAILVTQVRDLVEFSAPAVAPLYTTLWCVSVIVGPVTAAAMYFLHTAPPSLLQVLNIRDEIPTPIVLAIEFSVDIAACVAWIAITGQTATTLISENLQCPYVWHQTFSSTFYASGDDPGGDVSEVIVFVPRNFSSTTTTTTTTATTTTTTTTTTAATTTASHILSANFTGSRNPIVNATNNSFVPSSLIKPSTTFTASPVITSANLGASTSMLNPTSKLMPHNHSIIIAESHTCYPLLQNLAILTSLLAALFATSAILDVCAYARGAWFDAKDSRDRTRAEHLAALRRCARLGSARAGIGIHDAEFACVSPTRAKSPRDAGDTDRARLLPASPTDDSSPTGASASPLGGSAPEGWSPCKPGPSGSRRQSAVNIAEGNGFNFKGASSLVRTAVANSNGYGKSRVGSISVTSVPQPRSGAATPEQQRSRQGSVASLMRRGGKQ